MPVPARFGLSSNLAQQVCRRVAGSRKIAQQKNRPVKAFRGGFVTYDARIFSFREKDWTVSLTTVEGRERLELAIGNYQRGMWVGTPPQSATLVKSMPQAAATAVWSGETLSNLGESLPLQDSCV